MGFHPGAGRWRRWAADLRGTGYPDLFVANDYGVSELFLNEGGKRFREAGEETGIGYAPKSGMSAAVGDVLNEGRFGVYVSNISEPGILIQGNNFWMQEPGKSGAVPHYQNMANAMGVALGGWSFGVQFGDLNNDGFQDLYVTNGNISLDPKRSYWYDFSKVAGGNKSIIEECSELAAVGWPQPGRVSAEESFHGTMGRDNSKRSRRRMGVTDVYDGRSIALADFQNRGVLDAVVANQNGPVLLYRNTVADGNRWIEFELEGQGSNRTAIGAAVRVFWNGQQQLQEVSGGSGLGLSIVRAIVERHGGTISAHNEGGAVFDISCRSVVRARPTRRTWPCHRRTTSGALREANFVDFQGVGNGTAIASGLCALRLLVRASAR